MSSGAGSGGDSSEGSCEDSLESSSNAFQTMPNAFCSALEEFRANWKKELKQKQTGGAINKGVDGPFAVTAKQGQASAGEHQEAALLGPFANDELAEQQALAKDLFHKAVELEQNGKVYDAIPFYRKAVQIEPNIEFKCFEHQKQNTPNKKYPLKTAASSMGAGKRGNLEAEEPLPENLYEKFQLDLSKSEERKLLQSSRDPGTISTEMHISELPTELLISILRWVVSNQLDMRSLENCAAVCKGLYLLARDEELWKSACLKVWSHNVGTLLTHSSDEEEQQQSNVDVTNIPRFSSWRQMFIERERILFNGCYISKTTYLRMGENSFQDQYYRPVQLVEYYRYIRFLADGTVLMMTNSDEPTQGVAKLKNPLLWRPDVLRGQYRLFGSTLSVVVSKQQQHSKLINATNVGGGGGGAGTGGFNRHNRRGSTLNDEAAFNHTKYCIEFRILNTSKRKFAQLVWLHYSIVQTRNKQEITSEFELTPSKYPPLWFSPVRSYHLDSDAPLA